MGRRCSGTLSTPSVSSLIARCELLAAIQTPLPSFDEMRTPRPPGLTDGIRCELLEEFEHVRKATVLMFRHVPESAWLRRRRSAARKTSVRALAYITVGHRHIIWRFCGNGISSSGISTPTGLSRRTPVTDTFETLRVTKVKSC